MKRRFTRATDPKLLSRPSAALLALGDEGAVTMVFAIFASLLIGTYAMAQETIDQVITMSRIQMAIDVAVLSAGADMQHPELRTNTSQLETDAKAYLQSNLPTSYEGVKIPPADIAASVGTTSQGGLTVTLAVKGTMSLWAPAFFGTDTSGTGSSSGQGSSSTQSTIQASGSAEYLPSSTLELVMVLDNTGSMGESADGSSGPSKIAGLRQAASNLVATIMQQSSGVSVIGLVPFASTVNVLNALPAGGSWLSPMFSYNPTKVSMSSWGGCAVEPRDANGYLSPQPYSPKSTLKFTPYYYNTPPNGLQVRNYKSFNNFCGTPSTTSVNGVPLTLDSYGSINDCGFSSATAGTGVGTYYDEVANSGYGTFTLTQNQDCIGDPVTFLTTDKNTLTDGINRMTAGGSTIIPVGLLWGWRMLSSAWSNDLSSGNGWVSSDSSLPLPENTLGLQRVMIVMTDGENQIGAQGSFPNDLYFNGLSGVGTRSLAAPTVIRADGTSLANGLTDSSELHNGSPSDPSSGNNAGYPDDVNTYQQATCSAIKQSGVTVYAITFGSAASSAVAEQAMSNCASPGDYYHAPNNASLNSIFQQIAGNLGALRLIK